MPATNCVTRGTAKNADKKVKSLIFIHLFFDRVPKAHSNSYSMSGPSFAISATNHSMSLGGYSHALTLQLFKDTIHTQVKSRFGVKCE